MTSAPAPASPPTASARPVDLAAWPRRAAFEFFRTFERPVFDLCTRVDVAPLKAALVARAARQPAGAAKVGLSLACTWLALELANRHAPFRLRLRDDIAAPLVELAEVHGSTTVVRDDGAIGFAYLTRDADFGRFSAQARAAVDAVRHAPREAAWAPRTAEEALVYFTALPWVHFTSFTHARQPGLSDSIPRLAFGRAEPDGARLWLPLALQVHHALMDGLHAGRFVQDFEAACAEPSGWFG